PGPPPPGPPPPCPPPRRSPRPPLRPGASPGPQRTCGGRRPPGREQWSSRARLFHHREREGERCLLTRLALHPYPAAVRLDDPLGDIEAQARAGHHLLPGWMGSGELEEQARKVLRSDA